MKIGTQNQTTMKSDFKPGRWGYAFKDGKLYEFTPRHVLVLSGWPDPRAWLKRRSHNWRATRKHADAFFSTAVRPVAVADHLDAEPAALPSGQYLLPGVYEDSEYGAELEQRDERIILEFIGTIPARIHTALCRYGTRKWHALNLLARCPGAEDLETANPALFYALASSWVFHKPAVRSPIRSARRLVSRKQKHILEWLGFPATETARRILVKIAPQSLSIESLLYLRNALHGDEFVVRTLSHLPHINAVVIRLATDPKYRSVITPRLLADVGAEDGQHAAYASVFRLLQDTLRMAELVDWHHCPRQFCSLKRLKDVHDELAGTLTPGELAEKLQLPARFQNPPFAGTENIVPITTPDDLYIEGYQMANCVGSHAVLVATGKEYVYRVLSPVRATLSIRREEGNTWSPGEVAAIRNAPLPESLSAQVYAALFASLRKQAPRVTEPSFPVDLVTERDLRQLPLLAKADMAIYWRCVAAFGPKHPTELASTLQTFESTDTREEIA